MKVRNTAGFNFSIELPGALKPQRILLAGEVHDVPDAYQDSKQCVGLLAKGWLEVVDESIPPTRPAPKPKPPAPKRRRRPPETKADVKKADADAKDEPKPKGKAKAKDEPKADAEPKDEAKADD